jgi:nucleoside-diphosphate-sugar epimerase
MKSTRQFTESLLVLLLSVVMVRHQVGGFSLQMMAASGSKGKTAIVAGATGYIGKSVVRESVRQGYKTVALVRDKHKVNSKEGQALYGQFFDGADIVECDVTNPDQLTKVGLLVLHC